MASPRAPPENSLLSAPVTGEERRAEYQIWSPALLPGSAVHSLSSPYAFLHLSQPSFSSLTLYLASLSFIETFTELRVLLKHVDLCPYSGCEHRVVCATQVDDISCDRRAGLCWVDQRGIWYKTYVFTVCLWGAGYVYTSCVLLLLVYDTSLGVCVVCGGLSPGCVSLSVLWVHCVCLRAYHVSLCYLPFAYCTWLNLPGGDVFTYVRVSVCCLCCCLAG